MNHLARRAMAELGVERLVPVQLELDAAAVAAALVRRLELALLVDGVRRLRLPLFVSHLGGRMKIRTGYYGPESGGSEERLSEECDSGLWA